MFPLLEELDMGLVAFSPLANGLVGDALPQNRKTVVIPCGELTASDE